MAVVPDVGEPVFTEPEPNLVEMRFSHGDHEHGLRCWAERKLISPAQPERGLPELWRDGREELMLSYRVTKRLIKEGKIDLAGCPTQGLP